MKNYMPGQSMIEVLVALAMIAIVMTAVASVVLTALTNSEFSKDQNIAEQYAQDGMEIMHHMRDTDYHTFSSYADGTYCLSKGATSLTACGGGSVIDGIFLRQVTLTSSGAGNSCAVAGTQVTEVVVTVGWIDSKCSAGAFCHKTTLQSCLGTYNIAPTL